MANNQKKSEAKNLKGLLERLGNDGRYAGRVFECDPYFFTISGGELHILPNDTGESVKGGWFPALITGPRGEQRTFIDSLMADANFDQYFFDDFMDDYGDFDEDDFLDYLEEAEDEDSPKIYKKIKEKVQGKDSPFDDMEDFVTELRRYDLDDSSLYYEYEGEIIDLYENVSDMGEGRGVYESWDDSDWIDILENLDEYVIKLPDEIDEDHPHMHEVEFTVTLCCGHGDGGDICITVEVTDEEYELMKQCWRDGEDICDCMELEDLVERIEAEAKGEDSACSVGLRDDEDEDDDYDIYDDISCMVSMPDEICNLVDEEENE